MTGRESDAILYVLIWRDLQRVLLNEKKQIARQHTEHNTMCRINSVVLVKHVQLCDAIPSPLCPGVWARFSDSLLMNRRKQKLWFRLQRPSHKRYCGFLLTHSLLDYSLWEKLAPMSQGHLSSLWRYPCDKKLKPPVNSHMSEPSGKKVPHILSSLRMIVAPANIHTYKRP